MYNIYTLQQKPNYEHHVNNVDTKSHSKNCGILVGMWSVSCVCSNGEKHTENRWKTRETLVYQANVAIILALDSAK